VTDLTYRPAVEMLDDLAARRISARELLDAHLARHEQVHGRINAVVTTDLERARADAAAIDDARARGESLGPLAGLPITVKDGFDVAGMPAVSGVPALADRPKDCADADVVATVRGAGALPWGKTNVPLMLGDLQSFNDVYGTTNNPYDLARTPGGSSGGAAAALATGVTPLEIGSDIGGSLRHPANFCGVYSLKPTFGALSMRGSVPPGPGTYVETDLGVAGPMARTAADLRLLWNVLRDAPGAAPPGEPAPVAGSRVALWIDEPEYVVADEVRAGVLVAVEALRGQGVTVEEARPPTSISTLMDTYFTLLIPTLAAGFPDEVYTMLVAARPDALAAVEAGADRYGTAAFAVAATAPYRDVALARVVRQRLREELEAWFADWTAVLCPISAVPAFTHRHAGTVFDRALEVDGREVPYARMLDWIALATALHAPALAAPVTRTCSGLPVGAQLIGKWGQEARLLDLADALERATGGFRPPGIA
jgi:amidase